MIILTIPLGESFPKASGRPSRQRLAPQANAAVAKAKWPPRFLLLNSNIYIYIYIYIYIEYCIIIYIYIYIYVFVCVFIYIYIYIYY